MALKDQIRASLRKLQSGNDDFHSFVAQIDLSLETRMLQIGSGGRAAQVKLLELHK